MRKIFIMAFLLTLPVMANAEAVPDGKFSGGKIGSFMEQLTDEQKACLAEQDCPKSGMKMKKSGEELKSGQLPDKRELTEEEKAAREASRECMKKAFETCGIQMPERMKDDKTQRPERGVSERGISERK
ncbi:MAG: hypothetical protein FWE50_00460 [Alphaproteobacteria bacterium]|nr:hypothetical protein [Alphaproteobacteria bacterium]